MFKFSLENTSTLNSAERKHCHLLRSYLERVISFCSCKQKILDLHKKE